MVCSSIAASTLGTFCACRLVAATPAMPAKTSSARMSALLALEAGCRDRPALRLVDQVHRQRHCHLRAVVDQRQPHLPKAIRDPMLRRHDGALRDAICRPLTHHITRLLGLAQIGERLQADTLAGVAVAGGAAEIHWPLATEKQRLAQQECCALLGMLQ